MLRRHLYNNVRYLWLRPIEIVELREIRLHVHARARGVLTDHHIVLEPERRNGVAESLLHAHNILKTLMRSEGHVDPGSGGSRDSGGRAPCSLAPRFGGIARGGRYESQNRCGCSSCHESGLLHRSLRIFFHAGVRLGSVHGHTR